jgi:hypothetical protein
MEQLSTGISVTTSFFLGTHTVVITLLRHPVTGAIIATMFGLALVGWFATFLPLR